MVLKDNQKLIHLVSGDTICRYCDIQHAHETELYDLNDDPYEQKNRSTEQPELADSLRSISNEKAEILSKNRPDIKTKAEMKYDDEEEVAKRLEALGYK